MRHVALESLEQDCWEAPPPGATYLVRTVHRLRARPIGSLSPEELRIMIGQGVGLVHLVPVALERLAVDPLVEGDFYPADLLVAALRVGHEFWLAHPDDRRALREIVAGLDVARADPVVTEALRAFERAGS